MYADQNPSREKEGAKATANIQVRQSNILLNL